MLPMPLPIGLGFLMLPMALPRASFLVLPMALPRAIGFSSWGGKALARLVWAPGETSLTAGETSLS